MSQNLKLKMTLMGGASGDFTPPAPEGFITITDGPNVVLFNHSTTDVSCTATTTDLTPTDVDHYFGIWLAHLNPIDDEVKAGTNAIQSASSLSVASGVEATHSFTAVTADVAYKLHWLCEHPEESKRTRGTAVEFTLANAPPTGQPVITGTVLVGETLTCDPSGIGDLDGLGTFSYQWYRDAVAISGATNITYVIQEADEFAQLTVGVSYIDGAGKLEGPVLSDPTITVPEYNRPASGIPTIIGTVEYQETVTAGLAGISDPNGVPDYGTNPELWSFQWLRDDVPIAGATAISHLIGPYDVNTELKVQASFTDNAGFAEGPLTSLGSQVPDTNIEYLHNFDTATLGGFTHGRASDATMHDYVGDVVTLTEPDPAFVGSEYTSPDTYVDHGVGYGIQLEDESTNLCTYSEDLSEWTDRGTQSLLSSTEQDPMGGANGSLLTLPGFSNDIYEKTFSTVSAGAAITVSLYMQQVSATGTIRLRNAITGNSGGQWDIDVSLLSEAWERVTESHPAVTAVNPMIADGSGNFGIHLYGTAGDPQVKVFGVQHELTGFATSYIQTSGSSKTRAATSLSAPFSALSPLPAGGVTDDICGQVTFRLRESSDTYGVLKGIFAHKNSSTNAGIDAAVNANGDITVRFGLSTGDENIIFTGPFAAGVHGIRYRKQGSDNAAWLDGAKQSATNAAVFANAVDAVLVGENRSGTKGDIESQVTRIVPYALSDEDIIGDQDHPDYPEDPDTLGWPGWTEPKPIITSQPEDINFGGEPPPVEVGGLLYDHHMTYAGKFELERVSSSGETKDKDFAYGGTVLAVSEDGTKIFCNGHSATAPTRDFEKPDSPTAISTFRHGIGRLAIPALDGLAPFEITLKMIEYDGNFGNVNTGGPGDLTYYNPDNPDHGYTGNDVRPQGGIVDNGKLYIATNIWYDNRAYSGNQTHCVVDTSDLTTWLLPGTNLYPDPAMFGLNRPFAVGTFIKIPPEWQARFDNNTHFIGGVTQSITSGSVNGFSLVACKIADIGVTNPFPVKPAFYHDYDHPMEPRDCTYGGGDVVCANDWWAMSDVVAGGCWPEGTDTILFVGQHGTGPHTYKEESPDGCDDGSGNGNAPYRRQVWAYNANDILRAYNGEIEYWDPKPYSWWVLPEPTGDVCAFMTHGGMAYCPTNRCIYFVTWLRSHIGYYVHRIDIDELT